MNAISKIYTKDDKKPYDENIESILEDVIYICDKGLPQKVVSDKELRAACKRVNEYCEENETMNKTIYELEFLLKRISKSTGVNYKDLSSKIITKDVMVNFMNNVLSGLNKKTRMKNFPEVEGDPVIQIGTVVWRYGDKEPFLKHIVTLNSCDPIDGAIVEPFDTEQEVLCRWAEFIRELDPDIITGYNIFGFDNSFMYDRADELDCLDEFTQLGRIENYQSDLIEQKLSSSALGDNVLKYIEMPGRVQIDLFKVIQSSGDKLTSYKLDSVAEHYISGSIKNIYIEDLNVTDNTNNTDDSYCCLEVDNVKELNVGYYIIITYKADGDKFNAGQKLKIDAIDGNIIKIKNINIPKDVLKRKPVWGLGKDDVSPKDIFRLQNEGSAERKIVATYCIQDCALLIGLIRKLDIITNNIGMSNVCSIPFSYIFLRGQGIKIFSLVAKECRNNEFLIPVLTKVDEEHHTRIMNAIRWRNQGKKKNDKWNKNKRNKNKQNKNNNFKNIQLNEETYDLGFIQERSNTNWNYVIDDDAGYEGAIVLKPQPGIYFEPVSVLDYSSLYPSSMISENLSHDTYCCDKYWLGDKGGQRIRDLGEGWDYRDITYDVLVPVDPSNPSKGKKKNGEKTCRFVQYPNNEKGIIPRILMKLLNARKKARAKIKTEKDPFKKSILDGLQLAYKLTANSLYGQLGAKTSSIYWRDIAASTTAVGRELVMHAKNFVEANIPGTETVYGDTDSIFVKFKLEGQDGNKLEGKEALKKSIELGDRAEELIQGTLKYPHKLEYEKTFYPFILFTKKRYVGYKYEFDINKYKQTSMGIVLKRRDNAPIVKYTYGGIIKIIMNERNIQMSIDFLRQSLFDLINGIFDLNMLVITKTLRGYYKVPESIAHKVLADRMGERDPGNKPQSNDRIPYIYVVVPETKGMLQGDKIEHYNYVKEHNLEPDYVTYIENQILKPVSQIYELIVEKLDGYNKGKGYFDFLTKLYTEKYNNDMVKVKKKISSLKQDEVKRIIFKDIIREARKRKYKRNEITGYCVDISTDEDPDDENNDKNNDENNDDTTIDNQFNIDIKVHRQTKLDVFGISNVKIKSNNGSDSDNDSDSEESSKNHKPITKSKTKKKRVKSRDISKWFH